MSCGCIYRTRELHGISTNIAPPHVQRSGARSHNVCGTVSDVPISECNVVREPVERHLVAVDFTPFIFVIRIRVVEEDTDSPAVGHGDNVVLLPVGRELLIEIASMEFLEYAVILGFIQNLGEVVILRLVHGIGHVVDDGVKELESVGMRVVSVASGPSDQIGEIPKDESLGFWL